MTTLNIPFFQKREVFVRNISKKQQLSTYLDRLPEAQPKNDSGNHDTGAYNLV
jgi:hypothetical protein